MPVNINRCKPSLLIYAGCNDSIIWSVFDWAPKRKKVL